MKTKEFMFEAKKPKIRMPKQRDPNWQTMQAKATSGAAGEHKDRKRAEKQGDVKHRKDLIPMESIVTEDLRNFTDAGIPAEFAKNMLRKFQINHDAEISPVPGKLRTSDIENGDMIINVLPGDNVVAVLKRREYPRFSASYTLYHRLTLIDGKFQSDTDTSVAAATKGMAARGKFFRISSEHLRYADSPRRGEKPTPDEIRDRSTDDPLAGSSYDIYSYMNDTFMPKMKQKMEAMVDDIYANLRKLGNSRDNFRGSKTEQQQALEMAKAIENIASEGFTRSTMERFLSTFDKRHHGFASIPNNERELKNLLKTEPNARAKWAKTVLDAAKSHHDAVKNMIAAPVMKALKGEGISEGWGDVSFKVGDWTYEAEEMPEEDVVKIWHDAISPDGKRHHIDFSPYDTMDKETFKLWIKLGMPKRQGRGPLNKEDIIKMAQIKGVADLDRDMARASMKEGSDWGEPKEILADVLDTLEREVEWPLTEVMDYEEVLRLLAPIKNAVNQRLKTMDKDVSEAEDDWGSMSHREFKRRELQHELGHEDDPDFERKMMQKQMDRDKGPWYIRIDGKIYKQKGEPKVFDWKRAANNYALAILKNKPELQGKILLSKNSEDQ